MNTVIILQIATLIAIPVVVYIAKRYITSQFDANLAALQSKLAHENNKALAHLNADLGIKQSRAAILDQTLFDKNHEAITLMYAEVQKLRRHAQEAAFMGSEPALDRAAAFSNQLGSFQKMAEHKRLDLPPEHYEKLRKIADRLSKAVVIYTSKERAIPRTSDETSLDKMYDDQAKAADIITVEAPESIEKLAESIITYREQFVSKGAR